MCCFSGVVEWVADTNIFARPSRNGSQFLVYSMDMQAKEELAMVLPLPVPKNSGERAVRFINLREYPTFFRNLAAGFPAVAAAIGGAGGGRFSRAAPQPQLEVIEVGDFEASLVPTVEDFARLDKRFRLPDGVWEQLPDYSDYGFGVFKLKPGRHRVHPMAFQFPRVNPKRIFFPTVHIHDGKIHDTAEFDHTLYFQLTDSDYSPKHGWIELQLPAGMFMNIQKSVGLLDSELHCYQRHIRGRQKNADVWL